MQQAIQTLEKHNQLMKEQLFAINGTNLSQSNTNTLKAALINNNPAAISNSSSSSSSNSTSIIGTEKGSSSSGSAWEMQSSEAVVNSYAQFVEF